MQFLAFRLSEVKGEGVELMAELASAKVISGPFLLHDVTADAQLRSFASNSQDFQRALPSGGGSWVMSPESLKSLHSRNSAAAGSCNLRRVQPYVT